MKLWAATRRVVVCAAVSAAVVTLLVVLGDFTASVPALASARGLAIPLALVAPLALSTSVGYALTTGDPTLESVSVRPIALLDTVFVIVTSVAVLVAGVILDLTGHSEYGAEAGRNALGFAGLLLIGRPTIGPNAAAALPIVVVVLLAFFGADAAGEPRWWAWVLVDADDGAPWVVALVLLVLGGALALSARVGQSRGWHLIHRRHLRSRRSGRSQQGSL